MLCLPEEGGHRRRAGQGQELGATCLYWLGRGQEEQQEQGEAGGEGHAALGHCGERGARCGEVGQGVGR